MVRGVGGMLYYVLGCLAHLPPIFVPSHQCTLPTLFTCMLPPFKVPTLVPSDQGWQGEHGVCYTRPHIPKRSQILKKGPESVKKTLFKALFKAKLKALFKAVFKALFTSIFKVLFKVIFKALHFLLVN